MGEQAHVSSGILDTLLSGYQECSSSIASLRASVNGHIDRCMAEAGHIVSKLIALENEAEIRYQHASQLYYSCQRRQRYDDESGEYRPSCRCEERDMRDADDKLYRARRRRELAQRCLQDMEREVGYFNDTHGGGGLMDAVTNEYVPEATQRLLALKEKVDRYETLEIAGIDTGDASSSAPVLEAPVSKAMAFTRGTEKLRNKMEQNEQIFRNYCPKCHCCPCQCNRLLELMRERTR